MIYICPECGDEIPEEQSFCYSCGRKRDNTIRLDDKGNFIHSDPNKCVSCGAEMHPDDLFCRNCGETLSRTQAETFRPAMTKYSWIGLALAFIPGALGFVPDVFGITLFSIFGLGHLYFKKWKRGALFLMVTAIVIYIRYLGFPDSLFNTMIFLIFTSFIYILQTAEVFVLAFKPPVTEGRSG